MAITKFIPTIWSENLLSSLDGYYVGVANCNRSYEGDITAKGSRVKICGIGPIAIGEYTKNSDMAAPQELSDSATELVIDQAKYFNFQVDDIDKTQCSPQLLDAAMKNAASALASEADRYVFAQVHAANQNVVVNIGVDTVISGILTAREILYKQNVIDPSEIVVEITPSVATALIKEQSSTFSYNNDTLTTGCIGTIAGCKIFVSNSMIVESDYGITTNFCLVRTKRAIAFAEQLSEVEAYRPEKRFADAVKGLHLYGAKVIYPNEMVRFDVCFNELGE